MHIFRKMQEWQSRLLREQSEARAGGSGGAALQGQRTQSEQGVGLRAISVTAAAREPHLRLTAGRRAVLGRSSAYDARGVRVFPPSDGESG